jgi:hypothetical protein
MPTKRGRITLTRDPELEAALASARKEWGELVPDSLLMRELALFAARELRGEDEDERPSAEIILKFTDHS